MLGKMISGKISVKDQISPLVVQLQHANGLDHLRALFKISEMPWNTLNYICLEPRQKKIMDDAETPETKIELLLHLARLRGGISDLLEILAADLNDEVQLGPAVNNCLLRLNSKQY